MLILDEVPLKPNCVETIFTSARQEHYVGLKILYKKIICSENEVARIVMTENFE